MSVGPVLATHPVTFQVAELFTQKWQLTLAEPRAEMRCGSSAWRYETVLSRSPSVQQSKPIAMENYELARAEVCVRHCIALILALVRWVPAKTITESSRNL